MGVPHLKVAQIRNLHGILRLGAQAAQAKILLEHWEGGRRERDRVALFLGRRVGVQHEGALGGEEVSRARCFPLRTLKVASSRCGWYASYHMIFSSDQGRALSSWEKRPLSRSRSAEETSK